MRFASVRIIVAAAAIAMLGAPPAMPQAAGAFAAGEAVSSVISGLEDSVRKVITDLEGAYSRSAFDTRTHLIAVTQELQMTGEALIGKTFGELDKSQQKAFTNLKLTLDEWNKGNRAALERVDDVVNDLNSVIATLPFAKTWPRVLRYEPSYVVVDKAVDTIVVTVSGSWLGEGAPSLRFGTVECTRQGKTEVSLRFTCPAALFGSPKKLTPVSGSLTLEYRPDGWWQEAKSSVGLGRKRNYEIAVSVVPAVLGTYSGKARVHASAPQTQARSETCSHHNGHCSGDYPLTCAMTATKGWEIDLNSVSAAPTNASTNSRFDGVYDKTTSGFQLRATVRNNGSCAPPVLGQRAFVDAKGMIALQASWTERKIDNALKDIPFQPGTLTWGQELSIALPENTAGVLLTIRRADGKLEVVSGTDTNGWVIGEFRPELNSLVLRPSPPDKAF